MNRLIQDIFTTNRPKLIGLAYRITGNYSESEDIVAEAFLKLTKENTDALDNPQAWIYRVTSNLAYDHLKSARVQRQEYIGPWLPEPYIEQQHTPAGQHELDNNISVALMLMLEKLSAKERVAFILHDLFGFSFNEIADIVKVTPGSCRKLASRARTHLDKDTVRQKVDLEQQKQYAVAFFQAVKQGELTPLCELLKDDVTFYSDGGGKAAASLEVLQGDESIAEFFLQRVSAAFGVSDLEFVVYNGALGMLVKAQGKLLTAFQFEIEQQQISTIYAWRNPDKLEIFARKL